MTRLAFGAKWGWRGANGPVMFDVVAASLRPASNVPSASEPKPIPVRCNSSRLLKFGRISISPFNQQTRIRWFPAILGRTFPIHLGLLGRDRGTHLLLSIPVF